FVQKFSKMLEVSIIIFVEVKCNNSIASFIRDRSGWLVSSIAMDKEGLALFVVTGKHPVDMAFRTAKSKSSSLFVSVRMVSESFYHFVFFQFIHCQIYLSNNRVLLIIGIIEG